MGKKKKRKSDNRASKSIQTESRLRKRTKYPLLALAAGIALLVTGGYFLTQGGNSNKTSPDPAGTNIKKEDKRLRETRSTLSPQKFEGRVRRAYQVAREIPEVHNQLYCYCRCFENFNHLSLLSCFVGTHAAK